MSFKALLEAAISLALTLAGTAAPLQAVATTSILGDVVQQVAGEDVELSVLFPPDSDPHTFEPTPQDVALLSRADVVFVCGAGLEATLAIAVAANQRIRGKGFYQIALIWTYALSPAVAGTIWALMFAPATGIMPYIISKLSGGYKLNWMTSPTIALLIVSAAATWKMLGYNIVFYIAGLQNVPGELLEAARVDGAGPWRTFWRVTFPMLSPTTTFLLFVNMLYAFFQVFGLIDIMTRGGPGNATEILVYKLYRDGFIHLKSGYAAAQSFVIFIAIAVLAVFQLRVATRKAVYAR